LRELTAGQLSGHVREHGKAHEDLRAMKAIILSVMTALAVISTFAVSAQSAPVGSQQWWEEMDREGRGGRGS
jgi:hypothetical protein